MPSTACQALGHRIYHQSQVGTLQQAMPGMRELLDISAVPTETVSDELPQTCVLFAAFGCSSSSCWLAAQQAIDMCLLLHLYEVMLAFCYPMAKLVQGKEGIGPCTALASETCTAA